MKSGGNKLFITIEGGEGAGKSTQARLLAEWLEVQGLKVCLTREPGGTELGAILRKTLLEGQVSPITELLLYAADRAEHVATIIRPALERGEVVVCDRYSDSTIAYQAYGRGLNVLDVQSACLMAEGGVFPTWTFWLDIDPVAGLARARKRSGAGDRMETEDLDFHQRVREGFRSLCEAPHRSKAIRRLDASQSVESIARQIQLYLQPELEWIKRGLIG